MQRPDDIEKRANDLATKGGWTRTGSGTDWGGINTPRRQYTEFTKAGPNGHETATVLRTEAEPITVMLELTTADRFCSSPPPKDAPRIYSDLSPG